MTRNELIQAFDDNVDDELRDATFAASLLLKSSDSFDFKVGGASRHKKISIYTECVKRSFWRAIKIFRWG